MASHIPKNLTVAELNKLTPAHLSSAQKGRVARLLANPGTRHLLADRFLNPAQRATRKTNTALAQPVVPGSSVTQRDLVGQRNAATSLKYGGPEAQAGRDIQSRQAAVGQTAGYFDNYLAELRAHEANQAQINAQSQAAVQGLAGSVQGLGQQAGQVVAQGNQSLQAATGQAPASITQDASNASMLRSALTASFGAMLAGQGANASTYADTLSHVVGPGQKLQGLTRAQGDVTKAQQAKTDLAKEKGAFEQQFEDEFKTNESKNVLAGQIAGVKSQQEQQKIDIAKGLATGTAAKTAATTAKTKADTKKTQADIAFFNKHGYYPGTSKPKAATGYKPGGPGLNKYGYTADEWNALSPAARQKARAGKGSKSTSANWQTPNEQQTFWKSVDSVVSVATKLGASKNMDQAQRRKIAEQIMADPKNPGSLAVSVALDKIIGHLSPANVQKLHDNQIQVKTGGVPTRGQAGISAAEAKRRRVHRNPKPKTQIPGIGPTVT